MFRTLATVPLLLASVVAACGDVSTPTSANPTESAATLPSEERTVVSCIAPDEFGRRTGIASIEVPVVTQYEFGEDPKSKQVIRYPVSTTPISASAVTVDGMKILLPDLEAGDSEDWSSRVPACKNFGFIAIGQYALIGHFIGVGNPYPVDQNWFVHLPTRKVVAPGIENEGYLEAAGPDCLVSIIRGDSITPMQQDKWCAVGDGSKFRRVAGVISLSDPQGLNREAKKYYWFTCDRESGVGKASEKIQTIPVRETIEVKDPEISTRMDEQCAAWARSSSAY